ncbi:MAG TPA: hypothetical protein VHW69_15360 [Rhizomicrobium sp.]|nr:hypothetical protein [Rhizomicrobium sp.]
MNESFEARDVDGASDLLSIAPQRRTISGELFPVMWQEPRMIVSYLHNFIFIKTKKTGGTALEVALAPCCGPADIITPFGPSDEIRRSANGLIPRNFSSDPAAEQRLREAVQNRTRKIYRTAKRVGDFTSHMRAAEIKRRLSPDFWDGACKFTVERHPYEKAVSGAYYNYKEEHDGPLASHLDAFIRRGTYRTFEFYTIDGKPVVDEFLRHETLAQDLKRLTNKLGFSVAEELPRMKSRSRADPRPAREILSDEQKQIVRQVCREEFELLGYEP